MLAENCSAARSNPSPGSAQLTRNPEVFTMPKARHPEHVQENSVRFGWKLIDDDITSIDRAFSANATRRTARIHLSKYDKVCIVQ